MNLKADFTLFFHGVLLFPLLLAVVTITGREPFFITAPYFLLFMGVMVATIFYRKKNRMSKWNLIQGILLILLLGISLFNFSSFRYSLPIIFCAYLLVSQIFLSESAGRNSYSDFKYFKHYFVFYLFLSLVFIILPLGPSNEFSRFEGFLGSPTVYSAFLVLLYMLALPQWKSLYLKIFFYLIVFLFVFLSKTRLVLLLMIMLPLLFIAIDRFKLGYRKIFITSFLVLFFLYPAYSAVVEYFPVLVTMRYEEGRDRSFGLRFYLYNLVERDFKNQDLNAQLLGQGNEHSRLLVKRVFNQDLYPHNDFIRLVNDWGIIGAGLFFIVLFRYATRSKIALMIALIYIIQFYSNLIFNLFLVSILLGVSILSYGGAYLNPSDDDLEEPEAG